MSDGGGLDAALDLELGQDVGDVHAHRLGADEQAPRRSRCWRCLPRCRASTSRSRSVSPRRASVSSAASTDSGRGPRRGSAGAPRELVGGGDQGLGTSRRAISRASRSAATVAWSRSAGGDLGLGQTDERVRDEVGIHAPRGRPPRPRPTTGAASCSTPAFSATARRAVGAGMVGVERQRRDGGGPRAALASDDCGNILVPVAGTCTQLRQTPRRLPHATSHR